MKSLLKANIEEGENSCKCCIYCEKKNDEYFCTLKSRKTDAEKRCRKFEFDISVKSVKKKRKPMIKIDISDI